MPPVPDLLHDPQTLGITRALMKVGTGEPANYSLSYLASSENMPDAEAFKEFQKFTAVTKQLVVALRQDPQAESAMVTARLRQLIAANLQYHLAQESPLVTPETKYTKFTYGADDILTLTNTLADAIFAMAASRVASLRTTPKQGQPNGGGKTSPRHFV